MIENYEFRIYTDYVHKLFKESEGKDLGSVKLINITNDDPRFYKIGEYQKKLDKKDDLFYSSWKVTREYKKEELESARLLQIRPIYSYTIDPEDFGTKYDNSSQCKICGVGKTQIGTLKISKSKVPKREFVVLWGHNIVVNSKFIEAYNKYGLRGAEFRQVYSGNEPVDSYQLLTNSPLLNVSDKTQVGLNPFDFSEKDADGTCYKCPKGHTIGLNILSELFIKDHIDIDNYDFFMTYEKVGAYNYFGGLWSFCVCSRRFREMVEREQLKGFSFEVVHIV